MMTRLEALRQLTGPGEPYELIDIELWGRPCRAFRNAPPTLRDLYTETVSDLPFIVYEDERLSFADAWDRACRLGRLLTDEYGVRRGDRVAISMRNYPEWMIAFCAVTAIGGIAVAMNALWQPAEMAYALMDARPRVLIADQERLDRLAQAPEVPPGLAVLAVRPSAPPAPGVQALDEAMAQTKPAQMPGIDLYPDDDALILYTSGSTGHPKGVVSCHRNIINALLSWELDGAAAQLIGNLTPPDLTRQPASLLAIPLFHVAGSHAVFLASYRAQRRIVSMYKWDPDVAADLIEREQIAHVSAPAAITGDLVAAAARGNRDLSSLMVVGGGGAHRAPEQVRDIDKSFANAAPITGWGMTETNAIGTGIAGATYLERPESSGQASAVLDLRIVDEAGRELPARAWGELQVRGTSVFRAYWNRPDANAATFDGPWMRTGDVAYLDEEGFLFIVDRIKDLIIRGGENIGCGAVEAALLEHPAVLEASVYGVPDERLGEEVAASIFIAEPVTEAELRVFLEERLARFAIPRYWTIVMEPLPRTPSGKILRRQLRDEAIARLADENE